MEPGHPHQPIIADPVLDACDLYRFFHAGDEETLALRGVSISIRAGEIVAVTGPSGSGKSTLLACLAGLDEPDGGTVRVSGCTMSRRSETERAALRARHIGMLFQTTSLLDDLTVDQNLQLVQRLTARLDRALIESTLDEVGLTHRRHALPATLSGGEAARAGLALALINKPGVVLADEPTGELDGPTSTRVLDLLRRRADRGAAIVVVTHNPDVAAYADRELQMHDGRIRT